MACRSPVAGTPRVLLLALALGLADCSETPLNVAPVVDQSHPMNAPATPPPTSDGMYAVRPGDTLFRIAMTFHCGLRDLARWNGIDENAPIQVGQRLRVRDPALAAAPAAVAAPAAATPLAGAANADDVATPAEVHAVPLAGAASVQTRALQMAPLTPLPAAGAAGAGAVPALPAPIPAPAVPAVTAPAAPSPAPVPAPTPPPMADTGAAAMPAMPADPLAWIWPVDGRIVVAFDPAHSKGIDIAVTEDAPIRAVADGQVNYTGSPLDYGNLLILEHGKGMRTVYAHNKTIVVQAGQTVSRGQIIATGGKTGTGLPILHFEVRQKGVPVDPLGFLPPR